MHKYVSIGIWLLFIAAASFYTLQGKPPAQSQELPSRSQPQALPSVAMTLSEYNQQRIGTQQEQLRNLQEFKVNQESFNRDVVAKELSAIHAEIASQRADQSAMVGEERGAFGLLAALGSLAVFFQLRKNKA